MSKSRQIGEDYLKDPIRLTSYEEAAINKEGYSYSEADTSHYKTDPLNRAEIKKSDWRPNCLLNAIVKNNGILHINEQGDDIPRELKCPLSGKLFARPVVAADGNTYERIALIEYLMKHGSKLPQGPQNLPDGPEDDVELYRQNKYLNRVIRTYVETEFKDQLKQREKENEDEIAKITAPGIEAKIFLKNLKRQLDRFSQDRKENSAFQKAIGYNPPEIRRLNDKVEDLILEIDDGEKSPEPAMESVIKCLAGIKQNFNPVKSDSNNETSVSKLARTNLEQGLKIIDKFNEIEKEEKLLKFLGDEIKRNKITTRKIEILKNYLKKVEKSIKNKNDHAFSVLLNELEKDILIASETTLFSIFSCKSDTFTKNFRALKNKLEDQMRMAVPKKS